MAVEEAQTEVLFYQLLRRPLEQILPGLLEKSLARGWRCVARFGDPDRLEAMNAHLWVWRDDSFLPHGGPEDGHANAQPVYLTCGAETPNGAKAQFLTSGAEAPHEGFVRSVLLFDGHDEAAVQAARDEWRKVAKSGSRATFWLEDESGRWIKKAQSGG